MKIIMLYLEKKEIPFLIMLLLLTGQLLLSQTTGDYRSATNNTNWSTLASWERYNGTTWVIPTSEQGYPGQNSGTGNVIIRFGGSINLDISPENTIGSLNVGDGIISGSGITNNSAILSIGSFLINVNGNVIISNANLSRNGILNNGSGTMKIGGALSTAGNGTYTASTGTIEYNGGVQPIFATTYYNLTVSGNGTKTMQSATIVNSNVLINSGTILDEAGVTITLGNSSVLTVNGTLDFSSSFGTIRTANNQNATLIMGSSGLIRTIDDNGLGPIANASLQNQGTGIWTTTSININGTIEYYRNTTSGQIITDRDYNNLAITGTSQPKTWTIGTNRSIGKTITIAGNFTLSGNQTINIGGNWINNGGIFTAGTSTINLNGTSQDIGGLNNTTFYNLKLATGGIKTFKKSLTINHNLNIALGVTADLNSLTHSANTLTLGGTGTPLGSWGSLSSVATNKNSAYFSTTTGVLNITSGTCAVSATISGTTSICKGESGNFSIAINEGASPYTVVYAGGDGGILYNYISGSYVSISPSSTSSYTLNTVSDSNGCLATTSGSALVTIRPDFTSGSINTFGETICLNGDPTTIENLTVASGGDEIITYKWQANGIDIVDSDSATYNPPSSLSSTTIYTRWAKDNSCNTTFTQSSGSWLVTVNTIPDFTVCSNNLENSTKSGTCLAIVNYNITATGSPNPSLTYTFSGATIDNGTGTGSDSIFNKGITTVTVTASNSCGLSTCDFSVTVLDNEKPIVPILADIIAECSATASIPTTTDSCSGTITGTTSDALTYATQGTHVIHWTFDDGNGNSITVNQNVIIDDTTAPEIPILADVTGECSATASIPSTTDLCSGTITGTTSDALTYATQGTHVIHWIFDDGNENVIVVNQNVIIDDATAPEIPILADVIGECSATVSIPSTTDSCSGTITGTTSDALTYATQGTHMIHWTFDDGNGNSILVNQNVIINITPAPLASSQSFFSTASVADLLASGTNIKWYTSETGGTALVNNTIITTGTYYVSQTLFECESPRTAVTVSATPTIVTYCKGSIATPLTAILTTGTSLKWYTVATGGTALPIAPTPLTTTVGTKYYWVSQNNGINRIKITVRINALPTTPSAITGKAAQGALVGTITEASYSIMPIKDAVSYNWLLPIGVNLIAGQGTPSIKVNFHDVAAGVGSIGNLSVIAVNALGCNSLPRTLLLTKSVPTAPTGLIMTDGTSTKAITDFGKYIGQPTILTLIATPVATATSYEWELPLEINQLSGGNSNIITINFADVANGTTLLRLGVKAKNGTGVSETNNSALTPTTSSKSKLLTLIATLPAAPRSLKLTNSTTTTAITNISKYIGTKESLTLTASSVSNASSYEWNLPIGVKQLSGNASNTITIDFEGIPAGTTYLYLGVKAKNGVGISSTDNTLLFPSTSSTFKLLKVTASIPTTVSKIIGQTTGICGGNSYGYSITASALANSYTITAPVGSIVTSSSNTLNTSNILSTNDLLFHITYPENLATLASKTISISAVNGVGTSLTSKIILISTTMPSIGIVNGSSGNSSFQRCATQTFTIPEITGASEYLWTPSNGALIKNGQGTNSVEVDFSVVPESVLKTTLKVIAINSCAISSTVKSITLSSTVCASTGKFSPIPEETLIVYPNPVVDNITITNTENMSSIKIFNLLGQNMLSSYPSSTTSILNMKNLPIGTYLLEIQSEEKISVIKVIKN